MPRLIWVFAGPICHFVGFVMRRLICKQMTVLSKFQQLRVITQYFWHWWKVHSLLQDNLLEMDVEQCRLLLPIYQPVYLSLIENLLVKVQYPPDEIYDTWSAGKPYAWHRMLIFRTLNPLLSHRCGFEPSFGHVRQAKFCLLVVGCFSSGNLPFPPHLMINLAQN